MLASKQLQKISGILFFSFYYFGVQNIAMLCFAFINYNYNLLPNTKLSKLLVWG